ncbi:Tumor susceptibility gene 101 [Hypsibius exemplaris]|uniref:Tumor susceptibility gene 101 n=1 Tax=Hypsibius exemplaris TaxID=2072580 RepID=A0A1W0X549_HYPEX|nr:Tumor susceptibility gene 101 [Hypsibius exemplaris]
MAGKLEEVIKQTWTGDGQIIAFLLNPCLKLMEFEGAAEKQRVTAILKGVQGSYKVGQITTPASNNGIPCLSDGDLDGFICARVDVVESIGTEVEQFLGTTADPKCNILEYWKRHEGNYRVLAEIDRNYSAVKASSLYSEREFSVSGNDVTRPQNRLSPEALRETISYRLERFLTKSLHSRDSRKRREEGMAVVTLKTLQAQLNTKYRSPEITEKDLYKVISYFPDLRPTMAQNVFPDGSSRELMKLSGTIPITYRGASYNIPVEIWIMDSHPYNPPLCYVKPTAEMKIKLNRHIDQNGRVYLPYLTDWNHNSSDLLECCQIMALMFGEEPPVYSKKPNSSGGQASQVSPTRNSGGGSPVNAYGKMPMPNPPQPSNPVYPAYPPIGGAYPQQQPAYPARPTRPIQFHDGIFLLGPVNPYGTYPAQPSNPVWSVYLPVDEAYQQQRGRGMAVVTLQTLQAQLNTKCRSPEITAKDVFKVISYYPDLRPTMAQYVFPDGSSRELMNLSGTIPITYRGVDLSLCSYRMGQCDADSVFLRLFTGASYNIPVEIWIMDSHPYDPPLCYVKPTADMKIRHSRHIDHDGRVFLPCLTDWNHNLFDLLDCCQIMARMFGEEPPVFSKKPSSSGGQARQVSPTYNSGGDSPVNPHRTMPMLFPLTDKSHDRTGAITDEHIRASLLSGVEEKLGRRLNEIVAQAQDEIMSLTKTHDELERGRRNLDEIFERLEKEQRAVDRNIAVLTEKTAELRTALERSSTQEAFDVDEAIVPIAPLYKQLLTAYAEESALEDAMYYIGEALERNVIDLDEFLKHTSELSRKQFMQRALVQKCRDKAGLP